MELDEAITVTKLDLPNGRCYLMVGWQKKAFEIYIYTKENLWKGTFSPNRLAGFSRNLHVTEEEYYKSVKRCLSQQLDSYQYELRSGFFYWTRKMEDSPVLEGFMPIELVTEPETSQPDLIEVLIALNRHLKDKVGNLLHRLKLIKLDYQKCLKDTEEFLNLKIEMETTLCSKFLDIINSNKENKELKCKGDEQYCKTKTKL